MKRLIIMSLFFLLLAGGLHAQPCFPAEEIEKSLRDNFDAEPVRRGFVNENTVVEWWESPEGQFSIFRRTATGYLCVVDEGQFSHKPIKEPKGEDS